MKTMQEEKKLFKQKEELIKQLLINFGQDVDRSELQETPKRVVKMYEELLHGYKINIESLFKTFDSGSYKGLVTVTDIEFHSLCEHHMIPFFGKIHIGYVPNGKILGLSKFVRLVQAFSQRLQVQERITKQISDAIVKYLKPKGVIVYIEAKHLCMIMRGVKKDGCMTRTLKMKGVFLKDQHLVDNFFRQIDYKKSGKKFVLDE